MSDDRLTQSARSLLDAARRDGPSSAERSRIWEGVALAPQLSLVASGVASKGSAAARSSLHPGAAAAATKVVGASALAALTVGKLLLAGAVVGSALTVGLGIFVLRAPVHTRATATSDGTAVDDVVTYAASLVEVPSVVPVVDRVPVDAKVESAGVVGARTSGGRTVAHHALVSHDDGEGLMLEAARVSDARKDLAMGRATAALASLDAAARAASRSLEPEELSLRVRALRQLGRDAEAVSVEETLKARYPGSFLAH